MQNKYSKLFIASISLLAITASAQETVYPVLPQKGITAITHASVHVGNGTVLSDATILFEKGKITAVGNGIALPKGATEIDATGKEVYPGLILPSSSLGLREISSGVRGSNDFLEIGDNNADIRTIVSYNTDSKIINVLRSNGILLAHISPSGDLIEGRSSVVQLDAWNYEDAEYKANTGMYISMPSLMSRRGGRGGFMRQSGGGDAIKSAFEKIETIKKYLTDAKAYCQEKIHTSNNLKLEAARSLFEGQTKLYVRANEVKQMLIAIDLGKTFGINIVIVGGSESFQIAGILAENKIPVILDQEHALPATEDDDIDQPYKTPAQLQKAGVLFALNDMSDNTKQRNLSFNAGTAATYGLTKEEALSAITLNTAKVLGIDNMTGSIETGKDANIIISTGDIMDMRGNQLTQAFIQGRLISLDNKQLQLYERYKHKYGLK
ncbi:MAG: amidohydrolase family protein [Chitinophagia bacterium]|jgi:imidazolonepropionase-like amidohydrolase